MEIRANFEYKGKTYPVIIRKRKQKRVVVRYNGYEFNVSAPKVCSKTLILSTAKPIFIKILERNPIDIHDENGGIEGLYIFGEFHKIDDGFINVLGHHVLFQSMDDFYKRIKPFVYQKFEQLFRETERETNSKIYHEFKLVKVKGYFGQNMHVAHVIKINLNLVHFKEDVIKSVMYHELAHDFVTNHSQSFYNKLAEFDPYWKEHHTILVKKLYTRSCLWLRIFNHLQTKKLNILIS